MQITVWEEAILNFLYGSNDGHLFGLDQKSQDMIFNVEYRNFQIFGEFIENYLVDLRGEEYKNIVKFLVSIGFGETLLQALESKKKWERAYGAHFLGLMGYQKAESKLLELIYDPSPVVYLNAFEALHHLGSDKNLTKIIKNALTDKRIGNTKVIEILLSYGSKIDNILIDLLKKDDVSDFNKRIIVDILAERIVLDSSFVILDLAGKTSDRELKIGCIKALGILSEPDSLDFLIHNLESTDLIIRTQALRAIGNIGDDSAIPQILNLIRNASEYQEIYFSIKTLYLISEKGRAELNILLKDPQNPVIPEIADYIINEEGNY
ncbi:HEAT repeat domain-containing protein [candidate division KSB1 bacterium]